MAEDIIRKRMTNDGWIPVEERMPERDGFYLISVDVPAKIDEIKVHKVWFGGKDKDLLGIWECCHCLDASARTVPAGKEWRLKCIVQVWERVKECLSWYL